MAGQIVMIYSNCNQCGNDALHYSALQCMPIAMVAQWGCSSPMFAVLQGPWRDRRGQTYMVEGRHVTRGDHKRFKLNEYDNQISWGIGRYVVEQLSDDAAHHKRVRWRCSFTGEVRWEWTELASSLCDQQALDSAMAAGTIEALQGAVRSAAHALQPRDFSNLGAEIATILNWFADRENDIVVLKERIGQGDSSMVDALFDAGIRVAILNKNFANLDVVLESTDIALQRLQECTLQLETAIQTAMCSRSEEEICVRLLEAMVAANRVGLKHGALYKRVKELFEAQLWSTCA